MVSCVCVESCGVVGCLVLAGVVLRNALLAASACVVVVCCVVDGRFLVVLGVVLLTPKKVWSPGSGCETWPEAKLESFLLVFCLGIYSVLLCR